MSMLTPPGEHPRRRGKPKASSRNSPLLIPLACALIGAAVMTGWLLMRDPAVSTGGTVACTSPAASASAGYPLTAATGATLRPGAVVVNVYNATDLSGLASRVASDLKGFGFSVAEVGNDPRKSSVSDAAEVRHGTVSEAAAETLAAYVPGSTMVADKRKGNTVDLVLGEAFTEVVKPKLTPKPTQSASKTAKPSPSPDATEPTADPGC